MEGRTVIMGEKVLKNEQDVRREFGPSHVHRGEGF